MFFDTWSNSMSTPWTSDAAKTRITSPVATRSAPPGSTSLRRMARPRETDRVEWATFWARVREQTGSSITSPTPTRITASGIRTDESPVSLGGWPVAPATQYPATMPIPGTSGSRPHFPGGFSTALRRTASGFAAAFPALARPTNQASAGQPTAQIRTVDRDNAPSEGYHLKPGSPIRETSWLATPVDAQSEHGTEQRRRDCLCGVDPLRTVLAQAQQP